MNCDESRNLRIRKETFIPARAYDFTEILKRLHMIAVGPYGKASASTPVANGGDRECPSVGQERHFTRGDIVDRSDEADRTGVELSLNRRALLANLLHRLRHVGLGDFVDVTRRLSSFQGQMPTRPAGSSPGAR